MKIRRIVLAQLLLVASAWAAVDFSKPIPALNLPDGRVLKNATFANFKADTVLIRHAGGSVVVRYEFLPAEIRADAEAKRPGGPRVPAGDTAEKKLELKGQIYVQTRGTGAYKFANVHVYAFDQEHFSTWEQTNINPVKLPLPLAEAVTDADGRFKITVPSDKPYFIFAQASRTIRDRETEFSEWRVSGSDIKKPDEVLLSNDLLRKYRPVEIEKLP